MCPSVMAQKDDLNRPTFRNKDFAISSLYIEPNELMLRSRKVLFIMQ